MNRFSTRTRGCITIFCITFVYGATLTETKPFLEGFLPIAIFWIFCFTILELYADETHE